MAKPESHNEQDARPRPGNSGYNAAIERERTAWLALHQLKRDDPQYSSALAEWRAAADAISVEAERLVKTDRLTRVGMILPAPMLLSEGKRQAPFGQEGWLYEIKFDGWRLVAGIYDGKVTLMTRGGADATKWFPEITEGLAAIPGGPHVLDGEVCVLDDLGRSNFDRLQYRARRRKWYTGCDPVVFCAFDLLTTNGRSLLSLPVGFRKRKLEELLTPPVSSVLYVGHFDAANGQELFNQAKDLGLEGLVAKRLGSVYVPGERSKDWVKCKVPGAVPAERFKRS
jgi:bifunctional non-homologous end joining protein LigD